MYNMDMAMKEYSFMVDILPVINSKRETWLLQKALEDLQVVMVEHGIHLKPMEKFPLPGIEGKVHNEWFCLARLELGDNNCEPSLVRAARLMIEVFGKAGRKAQLYGDLIFPESVVMILHDWEKRQRRAARRCGVETPYIEPDRYSNHGRVHFTVTLWADGFDQEGGQRACDWEAEALARAVDSTFDPDLPAQYGEKHMAWWAAYDFGVRVSWGMSEFDMIEEAALRLYNAIQGKRVFIELDDTRATPLRHVLFYIQRERRAGLVSSSPPEN